MKGKRKEQFRAGESMIHMRRLVEYEDYLYYMKGKRKEQVNLWLICDIWLSTKTTFTTWRENGKSKWIYDSCDIWSSRMTTFINIWGWKWESIVNALLSSMPLTMGWLADLGPSYRCTCLSGYTDLEWVLARQLWSLLLCLSKSSTSGVCNGEGCGLLADS